MKTNSLVQHTVLLANPWKMLLLLFGTQVLVSFVGRSLAPLGAVIGGDLGLTKSQVGMLPAALFLGQTLASIPSGYLADRIKTNVMLLLLSFCIAVSFILATITPNFFIILLLIVIAGVGYGAMHPTSNRGIIFWFSLKNRGFAMGIKQMGITFGSASAALVLLPLATNWGWRLAITAASILLMLVGYLAYKFYRDPPDNEKIYSSKKRLNMISSVTMMFKHKPLLFVSICAMLLTAGQMTLNTYVVLFAFEELEMKLVIAGSLLIISEIGGSIGRIGWGIISDQLFQGKRLIVLVIISLLAGVSSLSFIFLTENTNSLVIWGITAVFGLSISGFNAIWMNAVTELAPNEQSGTFSGISITLGSLGGVFGPPIFGLIVDVTGMYAFGWVFLSALMLIVVILLLFIIKGLKSNI